MRIIIIGAGTGGLCLANGLIKAGMDVSVYEQQSSPVESLAGYGLHIDTKGRKALQSCLSLDGWRRFKDLSTSAGATLSFRDTDLRLLAARNDAQLTGQPTEDVERRGIGRSELRDIMIQSLGESHVHKVVHWGKAFRRYQNLADGRIAVRFQDGSYEEGDVLVGADGVRSGVRQQYLPDYERVDLGISVIAGRYTLDDARLKRLPNELTNGSLNNIVPRDKGWMFVSAWNSAQHPQSTEHVSNVSEHYVVWAYAIPKQDTPMLSEKLSGPDLQCMTLDEIRTWSPYIQEMVRDTNISTIKLLSLRSAPHLDPWIPSQVTLLGDSIHSMTPMAGVGANTALRDAELLTQMLIDAHHGRQSIVQAIGQYEAQMRDYANAAVSLSRRNAENATSGKVVGRRAFRMLLKLAHSCQPVMRATIGRTVIEA